MWIFTLYLLILWNGVFGSSDICTERVSFVCLRGSSRPSFPETEEEFDSICLDLQRQFRCIQNYAENCGIEGLDIAEGNEIQLYSEVIAEVCRKDTQLHRNVVENLPCLKDIFQNVRQQCQGFTRNAINHLYEHVVRLGNEHSDDNYVYGVFDCLYVAVQAHCFVTQTVQKCGSRAKEAVLEIMQRARLVDEECPDTVQGEVMKLLNILAVATEEEVHVRRLLGGTK